MIEAPVSRIDEFVMSEAKISGSRGITAIGIMETSLAIPLRRLSLLAIIALAPALRVMGQDGQNPGGPPPGAQPVIINMDFDGPGLSDEVEGIQPAIDRDAESWLRRAAEAVQREDWKLAADTLERIIREHGSTLVTSPDGTYRSAIEMAQAQIAALPPEGLEAYRILFDPAARRLMRLAEANHDLNPLREVARVYPMTTHGPEALDLLTVRLLDDLIPGEAIAYLNRLDALAQSRVPKTEIELRRVVALSLLGQRATAMKALDAVAADTGNDAGITSRIAAIREFIDSGGAARMTRAHLSNAWSSRLGPTGRGVAQNLSPLVESKSANVTLLPTRDKADPRAFRDVAIEQGRPPVWRVVSDGAQLFVSSTVGVMALDASTYEMVWKTLPTTQPRDPRLVEHRLNVGGFASIVQEADEHRLLDDYTTTSLFRENRGALTAANGLVFAIGQYKGLAERNPSREGVPVGQQSSESDLFAGGNTLFAYDARTGNSKWRLGQEGDAPLHPLKEAHFFCTPIAYGADLLVTYVRNGDLYLGVLAVDGELKREIAIGTGQAMLFPFYGVLEPTIVNGSVYVPSGAGLLTALYEHDLSLRWLARYERVGIFGGMDFDRPGALINHVVAAPTDEWLSTPPIQSGGCVLLAPQDADAMFAFDVETGRRLWSRPRGTDRYIVGATDTLAVVAGRSVAAIRLSDGAEVWRVDYLPANDEATNAAALKLSGRPVMFEDRVLVPTFDGLVALDLATGKGLDDRFGEGLEFGNLCAFDGALYSVGNTKVARYPDPDQSRDIAMAKLERDPEDVSALMKLAWLATLQSEWTAALDWLDQADAAIASKLANLQSDEEFERASLVESTDRVSHHRVSVLISMADESDDASRRSLLTRAYEAARLPVDRASAGLALASFEFSEGRETEAGALCVQLLEQSHGRPMRIDDRWRIQDALEIGRRLRQFYHRASSSARSAMESDLDAAAQRLESAGECDAMIRLADAVGFTPLGASLDLKIADRELASGLFESAFHHCQRAMWRADTDQARTSAAVRLLQLCAAPPEPIAQDADTARRLLMTLGDVDRSIPMSQFGPLRAASNAATLGEYLDAIASRLSSVSSNPVPAILRESDRLALMTEAYLCVVDDNADEAPMDVSSYWDPTHSRQSFEPVIPIRFSNQYRGIAGDADDLTPTRWAHNPDPVATTSFADASGDGPRYMAVSNRVAVIAGPAQVEAIGLDTGRAMWTPIPLTRHLGPLAMPPVVSESGIAVIATDPNTIVAAETRDRAAPLWRRTFPDRQIGSMRVVDGRLICLDESALRAAVIDMETGLLLREYDVPVGGIAAAEASTPTEEIFDDRDPASNVRMFAISGATVMRGQNSKVVGRVATTGEVAWELELDGGVRGISELDAEHAAIYHGANGIAIVNPANGRLVQSIVALNLEMPPLDAVLDRPQESAWPSLLLFTKREELKVEYVLASYSLEGGELSWHRELGGHATISPQMMRASSEYVAVVTNKTKEIPGGLDASGRKRQIIDTATAPVLTILQKARDRRIGPAPYTFYEGRLGSDPQEYERDLRMKQQSPFNKSRAIRDVIILDHRIIAVAPEGYYVLADADEVRSFRERRSSAGGAHVP